MNTFFLCSMISLLIGYILDLLFGDPYISFHPICLIGNLISFFEKKLYSMPNKRSGGRCLVIGVLSVVIVIVLLLEIVSYFIHPVLFIVTESVLLWFAFAQTSLKKESLKVYKALYTEEIEDARYAVSMIVGRDTKNLTQEGIIKATVETIAENTSDGMIAPLFYAMLFGGVGAYFYKAINTMDSMVGYKNEKYMDFGRCAAKLDDVVNFIPARLAALFMILAAYIFGFDGKNAWYIFKRDRLKHASPNSAQTESVCAGALRVRLAGDAFYGGVLFKKPTIGDDLRNVEREDIPRALRLMSKTVRLFMIFVILVITLKLFI